MSFFQNVRALKRTAPTAAQFNQLAANQELVKAYLSPRFALAKKSGNQALTFSVNCPFDGITFDTEVHDTDSLFSGGTFTIPTTAKLARLVVNIKATAFSNFRIILTTPSAFTMTVDNTTEERINFTTVKPFFAMGNSSQDGIQEFQLDTGWIPQERTSDFTFTGVTIWSDPLTAMTIEASANTWCSLEIL